MSNTRQEVESALSGIQAASRKAEDLLKNIYTNLQEVLHKIAENNQKLKQVELSTPMVSGPTPEEITPKNARKAMENKTTANAQKNRNLESVMIQTPAVGGQTPANLPPEKVTEKLDVKINAAYQQAKTLAEENAFMISEIQVLTGDTAGKEVKMSDTSIKNLRDMNKKIETANTQLLLLSQDVNITKNPQEVFAKIEEARSKLYKANEGLKKEHKAIKEQRLGSFLSKAAQQEKRPEQERTEQEEGKRLKK